MSIRRAEAYARALRTSPNRKETVHGVLRVGLALIAVQQNFDPGPWVFLLSAHLAQLVGRLLNRSPT